MVVENDRRLLVLALIVAISLALLSAQSWDAYVFIQSAIDFIRGIDPYKVAMSGEPKTLIQGMGPMWYVYPPLPILLWSLLVFPLTLVSLPISPIYYLAVKLPQIVSTFILSKWSGKRKWYILLGPLTLAVTYIHGMFDALVALLIFLTYVYLERDSGLSGFIYGFALMTKQHAILALPPISGYLIKNKGVKEFIKFITMSALASLLVISVFYAVGGSLNDMVKIVLGFHFKRPPNALVLGGFGLLSVYTDALSWSTGGTFVGLALGNASKFYNYIDVIIIPSIVVYILIFLFVKDPLLGIISSYLTFILLGHVGAVQHLLVPALLLAFVEDKRIFKLTLYLTTLLAIQHVAAFWVDAPMLVSPAVSINFGFSLTTLARTLDVLFWPWHIILRVIGTVLLLASLPLQFALLSETLSKSLGKDKRLLLALMLFLYAIELAILVKMGTLIHYTKLPSIRGGTEYALYPWVNLDYPGLRMGDYINAFKAPYGYFTLVNPVAERLIKANSTVLLVARLHAFVNYAYIDILNTIREKGDKFAWLIVLPNSTRDYITGKASIPSLSYLDLLLNYVKANTPVKGWFKLGGIIGLINQTLLHWPPLSYPGYVTCDGRPALFIYGKASATIIKTVERYGFCVKAWKGPFVDYWFYNLGATQNVN